MFLSGGYKMQVGGIFFAPLPIKITSYTGNSYVAKGSTFNIAISSVSGSLPAYYQILSGNSVVSSISSYTITNVPYSASGNYTLSSYNYKGGDSKTITLSVIDPLTNYIPSTSYNVPSGSTFKMYVSAGGSLPIDYCWYKGTELLSSYTLSSFFLPDIDSSSNGTYYCILSNYVSVLTSDITITVV